MTPLQRQEQEISGRRREAVAIREELDLATVEQLQAVVEMPAADIARGLGIHVLSAKRFRQGARERLAAIRREEDCPCVH